MRRRDFLTHTACALASFAARGTAASRRSPAVIRLQDQVQPYRSNSRDQTQSFGELLLKMKRESLAGRPVQLVAGVGTWVVNDDFLIDWDEFSFEGSGEQTVFLQKTAGRGLFRVTGDQARIAGFERRFPDSLQPIRGRYFGYSAAQRSAAVILHGSNCTVEDISVENSHTAICLRGPIRSFQGGRAEMGEDRQNFDWSIQAFGNRVRRIRAQHCEIGLAGNQQRNLRVEGLISRDTVQVQIPPHAIYMRPGGSEERQGACHDVVINGIDDRGNTSGNSVKLAGFSRFDVTIERSDAAAGVLTMANMNIGTVRLGAATAIGAGSAYNKAVYGAQINACSDVNIEAGAITGAPGSRLGGVFIGDHSRSVSVKNMHVEIMDDPVSVSYPYQVRERSTARFDHCAANGQRYNKPAFFCDGTSSMELSYPSVASGRILAEALVGAVVTGALSKAQVGSHPQMIGGADFSKVRATSI